MSSLRPSRYAARRNPADLVPTRTEDIAPIRTEELILSDGQGTFSVAKDGTVTVKSGYPNVGNVFAPGSARYDQIIKVLAGVSGNQARLSAHLGASAVAQSLSTPPLVSTDTGLPATKDEVIASKPPVWQRPWFLPVVIVGGVAIGGVVWLTATALK